MVSEHFHQRVLDELAGRAGREQGRTVRLPGVTDCVSPDNGLAVARLSVSKKIGAHEN